MLNVTGMAIYRVDNELILFATRDTSRVSSFQCSSTSPHTSRLLPLYLPLLQVSFEAYSFFNSYTCVSSVYPRPVII
jgi:hypothetical protein